MRIRRLVIAVLLSAGVIGGYGSAFFGNCHHGDTPCHQESASSKVETP